MTPRIQPEKRAAVRELLGMNRHERLQLLQEIEHEELQDVERGKSHPLKDQTLSEEDFRALSDHMLDGGGVIDRGRIAAAIAADLVARRQSPEFFANLIHYVKACLKTDGRITPHAVPEDIGPGVQPPVTINGV